MTILQETPTRKPTKKRGRSRSASPLATDSSKFSRHSKSHSSAPDFRLKSVTHFSSDELENLQGSSRTTGGFMRGNALGNAPNMADTGNFL